MEAVQAVALLCYPTLGGSGRIATELAGLLSRRGLEVHLISYARPACGIDPAVQFHRVHVMEYPLLRYPPYDQALAAAIVELHHRSGVCLFHAHYALPHALAVILADEMLGGDRLRLVTTLHGTDITLIGSNPAYREPLLFGLRRSRVVTAVSESLAADTREILGFGHEILVIPNFVDSDVFRPGSSWLERDGPRQLVNLSTFRPVKRIKDLCLAVAVLQTRLPVRLTLIGDGPERAGCEAYVKDLGMADAIRLVGAVEDPAPCLADADLYLFSSRTESFGLGVLEAMASALPVVGPRVGGVSEVLGNPPAGRLLRPSSPLALAEAAHEILTCPETYRQLADRARSRAREVFRPERVVELYLGAYARALVS